MHYSIENIKNTDFPEKLNCEINVNKQKNRVYEKQNFIELKLKKAYNILVTKKNKDSLRAFKEAEYPWQKNSLRQRASVCLI